MEKLRDIDREKHWDKWLDMREVYTMEDQTGLEWERLRDINWEIYLVLMVDLR